MKKMLRFGILNALLVILSVALALAWQHELRKRLALTDAMGIVLAHPVLQISHRHRVRYSKFADISIGGLYFLPAHITNPPTDVSILARLYYLGEGGDTPALSCTDTLGRFRSGRTDFALTLRQVSPEGLAPGSYVARVDCVDAKGRVIATDSIFLSVVDQ